MHINMYIGSECVNRASNHSLVLRQIILVMINNNTCYLKDAPMNDVSVVSISFKILSCSLVTLASCSVTDSDTFSGSSSNEFIISKQ